MCFILSVSGDAIRAMKLGERGGFGIRGIYYVYCRLNLLDIILFIYSKAMWA